MKWLLLVPIVTVLLLSFNYRENLQQQIKSIAGVATTDTIPELPRTPYPVKPNSKGNYVDVRNYNGECIVVVESGTQEPIARIPLTKWNADQKKYNDLYGEIPALPKPPAPPPAPVVAKAPRPPYPPAPALSDNVVTINIHQENNYNRNKNSYKKIATVTLKNGKQETYNLDNASERSMYEKKYGALPTPPPPPAPPVPAKEAPVSAVAMPDKVLILVDGKEITKAEVKKIQPAEIAKVEVFKDETAIREYGEKGKNGVIKITTKTKVSVDVRPVETPMKVTTSAEPVIKIKPVNTKVEAAGYKINPMPSNVLVIVDGVETTMESFNASVKPEEIASMSVLKDERANALYGEKGKNGVFLITTKKSQAKPAAKTESIKQ